MPRILLMSLGSRGDVEPFLAYGEELLQTPGNEVGFCLSAQFEESAREVSEHFFPMDPAFLDLFDRPELKKIMGQVGSGWSRIRTLISLAGETKAIQKQLIVDQEAAVQAFQPDQIIFHIKCIYPIIWALDPDHEGHPERSRRVPGRDSKRQRIRMLLLMPCLLHPVRHEPSIGFGKPRNTWWNLMTYRIAEWAMIRQSILSFGKKFLKERGIKLKYKQIKHFMYKEMPVEYGIEESLFPRPDYWPQQVEITHFRSRNRLKDYTPPADLVDFLEKHPKPLYVGFGSMVNANPRQVGEDILAVCMELGQPVIINSSWGGIELPEVLPDWAYPTTNIPFDYLFPKVGGAVHHGGSGTTHSAFLAGVPQVIIPHIADQFLWARIVVRMGVGYDGFPIKNWSRERFRGVVVRLCSENLEEVNRNRKSKW